MNHARVRSTLAVGAALSLALALLPGAGVVRDAQAAGFGLYEQGARALGFAGAFTARADDPSAMFFNPAGLAALDGKSVLVSPNLIQFKSEFSGVAPYPGYGVEEETEDKLFPPVAFYYAQGINRKVAAGIGVYSPYGLEIDWKNPDSFTGRYISTQSKITPFFFVPTVAWAPSPKIRLGAGAQIALSTVKLERHIAVYNPLADRVEDVGTVTLDSHPGYAVGFNAGVQWWPDDKWRVGATYRSKLTISYDGTADFEQRSTGDPTFDAIVAAGFPKDQGVNTSIPFPAQGSLGVGMQVSTSLALEADFNYTWWSAFDRLDVAFQTNSERDLHIEENWDDVFNIRTGFEYRHAGTSPWAFRGGYYFDQSPQPTEGVGPLLPDADRHGISGGLGWRNAKWSVDAYALCLIIPDRSTEGVNRDNYNGTYSDTSVLGGLSIGAHF